MTKHLFFAASRPVDDATEDEYNEWYEQHLRELITVEGVASAQRFLYTGTTFDESKPSPGKYLAVYEFETDGDPADILKDMTARSDSGEISFRTELIGEINAWIYSPVSAAVTKADLTR